MRYLLVVCSVGLSLVACSAGSIQAAAPPPAGQGTAASAQMPQSLTEDQVRNMQVQLVANDSHRAVQLANGQYHNGSDPASPDYADVQLVADHIALGDLNGDGLGDAAVLMSENYGGSGVFVSLIAVLDAAGKAAEAGAVPVDDRPQIGSLEIQQGHVTFSGKIHGPNDPGCCAALPVTQTYGMTKSGLVLLRLASQTPDGTRRSIMINSPAPGTQIPAGLVEVRGSFTVAPFENTLTYRVFDAAGNTLAAGPLPVTPPSGAAGTFDGKIDLTSIPAGVIARVEITDISPADGSTLAMDSVELMIK